MVIIGVNKINLFFNLGKKEFTTFYCPGWNNIQVNFLSFQFSLAHSNDGFLPNNKEYHSQLLLGFFFSPLTLIQIVKVILVLIFVHA